MSDEQCRKCSRQFKATGLLVRWRQSPFCMDCVHWCGDSEIADHWCMIDQWRVDSASRI